jgi:hypothetical protein
MKNLKSQNKFDVVKWVYKYWEKAANNGKGGDVKIPVMVGFTQRETLQLYMASEKGLIKDCSVKLSHKLQALAPSININNLTPEFITTCHASELADTVNKNIDKFDTINSGWQTQYHL